MIDKEGWYSVTPEPFAEYLAVRVEKKFKPDQMMSASQNKNDDADSDDEIMQSEDACDEEAEQECINILDAFGGVGGNMI